LRTPNWREGKQGGGFVLGEHPSALQIEDIVLKPLPERVDERQRVTERLDARKARGLPEGERFALHLFLVVNALLDGGSGAFGVMNTSRDHWKGEEHKMGELPVASSASIPPSSPLDDPLRLTKQTF
jgi:hypothetical protein